MDSFLTNEEKQAVKVLNFTATFDGIITCESDIIYILQRGIVKFIPKKRRHLVEIKTNNSVPKIKIL